MNRSSRSPLCRVPLAFVWSYRGAKHRVAAWPDVQFERHFGADWVSCVPAPDALVAGAQASGAAWRSYLEFVPADVRELLGFYRQNRLIALEVAARCPDLVGTLLETPALLSFVSAHATPVVGSAPRWHEVNAVFERGGVFALLELVGLPASRQTLAILRNLVSPDVSSDLIEPLRKTLWRPQGVFALAQLPAITDRDLNDACALAA